MTFRGRLRIASSALDVLFFINPATLKDQEMDCILNQSRKTIMSKLSIGLIDRNRRHLSTLLALKNGVRTVGGSKRSNHNPVQHLHYDLIIFIGTKMARTVFMGIDVSKETLDISINNKHQRIENAERAISEFIKSKMADVFVKLCVVESTGGYEKLVIKLYNIAVHRAHPNRVYAFAKACNHFAKTDKLDAKLLEKYADKK